MIVTDTAPYKVSSWNRQTYQRLKLALSLGLRRQIFVVVCDDLSLRNRLVDKLDAELGVNSAKVPTDLEGSPKLVSLELNLSDPNPLAQIAQWLAQNRQSIDFTPALAFQILGVERLTRQPPSVQRSFLRRLQAIARNLSRWESTLVLWLPRPWFHMIQQSVPEFWHWHTGLFEFEGEPTPLPPVGASRPEASPASAASEESTGSFQEELRSLLARDLSETDRQQSFDKISWKKPPQKSSTPQPPPSETLTDKANAASPPATESPTGIPFSISSSKESVPLAEQDTLTFGELREDELSLKLPDDAISLPLTPHNDLTSEEFERELVFEKEEQTEQNEIEESSIFDIGSVTLPSSQSSILSTPSPTAQTPSQPAASPADAYLELGNYYRQAIEQGNVSEENLMIAIQAYEQALHWIDHSLPQVCDILNDLGNLYWMLSRCPESVEAALSYVEQAIQAYQLALAKLTAEEVPHTYSMIQNNLGAAYSDLARYKEPAESLEQSIRAYEEALRYRRADSEPLKYASTQNNLGTAYWNLAQHQSSVANLRSAIAAYKEALFYYSPESEPLNWAMIHNNLGTAYWNLAQYEQPETWLPLATAAYQEALKYRTPDVTPAPCAATQNNLGTAYWHLADHSQNQPKLQAEYLEKCIAAYNQALDLTQQLSRKDPPIAVNFDVLATHNNLGLAHYQLATEPQFSLNQASKSAHLEAALEQHIKACTGVAAKSDAYQTALSYIIKTIRAIYQESGTAGQNRALSKVPGQLLPEILPRL